MKSRCLCTLADVSMEGYSPVARRALAGGNRTFPHRLSFNRSDVVMFRDHEAQHLSISGVQDKISLRLERGKLVPTEQAGEFMLKPIPALDVPKFKTDIPANEHLTMQIAGQVFGIQTAISACIYFADGELAYLTRRFDRLDGVKIAQEDFCQLSNRSEETAGKNYKYDASYEEMARLLKQFCGAYAVEVEKLFLRILFNYIFSNGDAHLKNFSLQQTAYGDYLLTPAYDLLATSLHFPNESRSALDFFDAYESAYVKQNGFYGRPDFTELADRFGVKLERANRFMDSFVERKQRVFDLIRRSFLSEAAKEDYALRYLDRLQTLSC
jgi:serine/threonine-protein kinase HipA